MFVGRTLAALSVQHSSLGTSAPEPDAVRSGATAGIDTERSRSSRRAIPRRRSTVARTQALLTDTSASLSHSMGSADGGRAISA